METVTLKINGMTVTAPKGATILEAARLAGIDIPTLCFLKEINEIGACRICVVEVKGAKSLVASCVYPVNEGMEVFTNTKKVLDSRRKTLQLLLSNHIAVFCCQPPGAVTVKATGNNCYRSGGGRYYFLTEQ